MRILSVRCKHFLASFLQRFTCLSIALFIIFSSSYVIAGVAPPRVVTGSKNVLVVVVQFDDIKPRFTLQQLKRKISKVRKYFHDASYGKVSLNTRLVGWYEMPKPLKSYSISPYNYRVDKNRVRHLLTDSLSAARKDVKLNDFDCIWILVGVFTRPGKGYGMIAYAANPGMLSGVRTKKVRFENIKLRPDGTFNGPVIVSAENAHIGHIVHDMLHAMGGVQDGKRTVVDLYDFDLQSNPPKGKRMSPALFAIHAGPWDIMSQHFIQKNQPPPLPSSFTRLQLGWISPDQVITVHAGETHEVTLSPLAGGNGILVVRIPINKYRYLLLENRQPVGGDKILPSHGLIVLEVDTSIREGAGIVKVADANPDIPDLQAAPFVPDRGERRVYENLEIGIVVKPLAIESNGNLKILITKKQSL